MNIIFYNLSHIGDTFIVQPLIKQFCEANSDYNISVYTQYNWGIYKEIPNLKIINEEIQNYLYNLNENHIPEHIINYSDNNKQILNMLKHRDSQLDFLINDNFLYINTWYATWPDFLSETILNPIYLHVTFYKIINYINSKYNLSLKFIIPEIITPPILPYVDLTDFISYKNNNIDKRFIFYYNLYPRSGQSLPVSNHESIIEQLALKHKNSIIIIPIQINKKYDNVICTAELFNCMQVPSCDNVIKNVNIAMLCDYVISYDIGACLYHYNSKLNETFKGIWYHIGKPESSQYYNSIYLNDDHNRLYINENYKTLYTNDNKIKQILLNNNDEINNFLLENITI